MQHSSTPAAAAAAATIGRKEEERAGRKQRLCAQCGVAEKPAKKRGEGEELIECGECGCFFHLKCALIDQALFPHLETIYCNTCLPSKGEHTRKSVLSPHRLDSYDPEGGEKEMQVGSRSWIDSFRLDENTKYPPPSPEFIMHYKDGFELIRHFEERTDWNTPILVDSMDGLGMKIPTGARQLDKIMQQLGAEYTVDAVDVFKQATVSMSIEYFRSVWETSPHQRRETYNTLGMELTGTPLLEGLLLPLHVRRLSWSDRLWPNGMNARVDKKHKRMRPPTDFWTILSMQGSFTSWHVDLTGASSWISVYQGTKVFLCAPPTPHNLRVLQQQDSDESRTIWIGCNDNPQLQLESIHRYEIGAGSSFFVPGGWLHSVLTPEDSIMVGSSYLCYQGASRQFQMFEKERKEGVDRLIAFPHFQMIHWYMADELRKELEESSHADNFSLSTANIFINHLRQWMERDKSKKITRYIRGRTKEEIVRVLEEAVTKHEEGRQGEQGVKYGREEGEERQRLQGTWMALSSLVYSPLERRQLKEKIGEMEEDFDVSFDLDKDSDTDEPVIKNPKMED